jgi:hypothetical protein
LPYRAPLIEKGTLVAEGDTLSFAESDPSDTPNLPGWEAPAKRVGW